MEGDASKLLNRIKVLLDEGAWESEGKDAEIRRNFARLNTIELTQEESERFRILIRGF